MGALFPKNDFLVDSGTLVYGAGARKLLSIDLPKQFIKRVWLYIHGPVVISGVTVPGRPHFDGFANLIQNIEAQLDGKPYKLDAAGAFFRMGQNYDATDGLNSGLVSGAAGTYNCHALIPLCCEMPGSPTPIDTLLSGLKHRKMQLYVTFGDGTSLIVGNTSTVTPGAISVDVYMETVDPFPIEAGHDFHYLKETVTPFQVAATVASLGLPLEYEDGTQLRAVQFRAYDGTQLSDDVMNSITLKLNGKTEIPLNTLGKKYLQGLRKHRLGVDTNPTGYLHVELADNGLVLTTGLGAKLLPNQLTSIRFEADVTLGAGATQIMAHAIYVAPPNAYQAAQAAA